MPTSLATDRAQLVTVDNFVRAECDMYFDLTVKHGGLGRFVHYRSPMPIGKQTIVRANRDTLYSSAVFDLDAGPVTITLPDAGTRFMSMIVIDQDHHTSLVVYRAGAYTFRRDEIDTRYVLMGIRTLFDAADPADLGRVHTLQDSITVSQQGRGRFEIPAWDEASQKKVRDGLLVLGSTLPHMNGMFGARDRVDPVRHLIGAAMGWGGNPDRDAMYLSVTPRRNDGTTIYRLTVNDVPVDAFWSISVYNLEGYFQSNQHNVYNINNTSATKGQDGSVTIQFGGYDGRTVNCLPITPGWNYMVRLYRPRQELLNGSWIFPEAQPVP